MKTKKLIVSVLGYLSYGNVIRKLDEMGIVVLKKSYDTEFDRYDVLTDMTLEQAYEILDFVTDEGGILQRGES